MRRREIFGRRSWRWRAGRLAALVPVLAVALVLPAAAFAGKSYTLPRATVSVTLARNGELAVREDLTYRFSGHFSGAFRDIPLAPGVDALDVQVSEAGHSYAPGGKATLGSSDAPGRYGLAHLPEGLRIVWHYRQDGGERTFTLRYHLRGVVVAHDDAVEVAPQVWGREWHTGLAVLHASVRATTPGGAAHAWVEPPWLTHGVAVQGGDATVTVDRIPRERGVTLRVLYPPTALAAGAPYARHVHDRVLAATEARERSAAARAVRDHAEVQETLHHPWAWILAAIALAIVPAGLLAGGAYWRLGRDPPTGSAPEYVHEPPDDLPPALVPSLLAQRLVVGGDQLAATLFELIRRGRYRMTAVTRERSSLGGLRAPEIDDVELTPGTRRSGLGKIEKPVAAIFDRLLTADHPVALSRISDTVGSWPDEDRQWFHDRRETFELIVESQARKRSFWTGRGLKLKRGCVIALALGGFGLVLAGVIGITDPPLIRQDLLFLGAGVALGLNALVVLLTPASMWNRRARELQATAEHWEAFRRYLHDFPRLADKPADTLPLWESYLVYGIAFGLADRVMAAARMQFPAVIASPIFAPMGDGGGYASSMGSYLGGAFGTPMSASSDGGAGGGGGGDFGGGGGGAW